MAEEEKVSILNKEIDIQIPNFTTKQLLIWLGVGALIFSVVWLLFNRNSKEIEFTNLNKQYKIEVGARDSLELMIKEISKDDKVRDKIIAAQKKSRLESELKRKQEDEEHKKNMDKILNSSDYELYLQSKRDLSNDKSAD